MSYFESTDTLINEAKQYQKDSDILKNMILDKKLDEGKNKIEDDVRDFAPMILAMGIEGATREERERDMRQKVDRIVEAFSDPDRSKREPYLNAMYDFRDTFDPETADMNQPEDVRKVLAYIGLGQSYATKRKNNIEYFEKRYPDERQKDFASAANSYADGVCAIVLNNLSAANVKFKPGGISLPHNLNGFFGEKTMPFQKIAGNYMRNNWIKAKEALETGVDRKKSYELTIPDELTSQFKYNMDDLYKMTGDEQELSEYYGGICMANTILRNDAKEFLTLHAADIQAEEAIFIDGLPVMEFLKKQFPKEKNFPATQLYGAQTLALLSGEHRVEIMQCHKEEDGSLKFEAVPVKVNFTEEQQQQYKKAKYGWFRRTFFDWGPFRIESLQEKSEKLYQNDPKKEKRFREMQNRLTKKYDENTEKQRIAEEKEKVEKVKKEIKRKTVEVEKTMLEKDIGRWEKDSVLGLLGEKAKNGLKEVEAVLKGDSSKRRNGVLEPMAKLVLFSLVSKEHELAAARGLELPGKMEKGILGNGTKEDMERNISNAVEQFVNDDAFKGLLYEKLEHDYGKMGKSLRYDEFVDHILMEGGISKFAADYMKKHNEVNKGQENTMDLFDVKKDDVKIEKNEMLQMNSGF